MVYYAILGEVLFPGNLIKYSLKSRLQKLLDLFQLGDVVIVCGGNVCGRPNCQHSEAYVMKKYLIQHGLEKSSIVLENRSQNTIENIDYLQKKCRQLKIPKITIISSQWHLPRVKIICQQRWTISTLINFIGSKDKCSTKRIIHEKKYLKMLL